MERWKNGRIEKRKHADSASVSAIVWIDLSNLPFFQSSILPKRSVTIPLFQYSNIPSFQTLGLFPGPASASRINLGRFPR
jgi:hypothetical protein